MGLGLSRLLGGPHTPGEDAAQNVIVAPGKFFGDLFAIRGRKRSIKSRPGLWRASWQR